MAERGNTTADLSTEKGTSDLIAYLSCVSSWCCSP